MVALSLLVLPAGAKAATVTVQEESGGGTPLVVADLGKDVNREYTLSSAAGDQKVPVSGTSMTAVLDAAKADLFGVKSIEISGAGRTVVLAPDQLSGGGAGSPVIYADGSQAVFLRPAYSPGDLNGNDRIAASALRVRVLKRPTLKLEAKVSDAAVQVGERVTFTATSSGAVAGRQLSYNWTFTDGSRRRPGARVTHAFREKGTYRVLVSATTPDDKVGVTTTVDVRVGPAPKGPDRKGGGTNSDSTAPDGGTADGTDSGTSGGTGAAASGPARPPAASPPAPRSRRPATDPGGRTVEGTLLADATAVPPRPAARKRAARTGNDRDDGGGFQLPAAAWGALLTLGLAGTGAVIELRTVLPWPRRRPA